MDVEISPKLSVSGEYTPEEPGRSASFEIDKVMFDGNDVTQLVKEIENHTPAYIFTQLSYVALNIILDT